MTEYLYFQSIVQYRIKLPDGRPEVVKRYTTAIKGAQNFKAKKKKVEQVKAEVQEEIEI